MKGSLCRLAETSFLWRDTAMRIRERFNPRAPCGARPARHQARLFMGGISTHAPLAGRDENTKNLMSNGCIFQPTRPLRGATEAPEATSDSTEYFNPRAPCGARRRGVISYLAEFLFQPTRPLRGATSRGIDLKSRLEYFNPRAPCGARPRGIDLKSRLEYFNPRAPCGARRYREYTETIL